MRHFASRRKPNQREREDSGSCTRLAHSSMPAKIKHIQSSPVAKAHVWSGLLTSEDSA